MQQVKCYEVFVSICVRFLESRLDSEMLRHTVSSIDQLPMTAGTDNT